MNSILLTRMTIAVLSALALALCIGCVQTDLSRYAALGPSADIDTLQTLSIPLPMDFVYERWAPEEAQQETHEDILHDFECIVEYVLRRRPGSPAFRTLCALLNRHFGKWERLVIIERVGFVGHAYGFAVAAISGGRVRAVTNLQPEKRLWHEISRPYGLEMEDRWFRHAVAELDRARQVLPERLFWFEAVDWPLYILHDVKADGSAFSFGICGWGSMFGDRHDAAQAKLDYTRAAELVNRAKSWTAVPDGSPRASELQSAGRTYATLLAKVWESILGRADFDILGGSYQNTVHPIAAQGKVAEHSAK